MKRYILTGKIAGFFAVFFCFVFTEYYSIVFTINLTNSFHNGFHSFADLFSEIYPLLFCLFSALFCITFLWYQFVKIEMSRSAVIKFSVWAVIISLFFGAFPISSNAFPINVSNFSLSPFLMISIWCAVVMFPAVALFSCLVLCENAKSARLKKHSNKLIIKIIGIALEFILLFIIPVFIFGFIITKYLDFELNAVMSSGSFPGTEIDYYFQQEERLNRAVTMSIFWYSYIVILLTSLLLVFGKHIAAKKGIIISNILFYTALYLVMILIIRISFAAYNENYFMQYSIAKYFKEFHNNFIFIPDILTMLAALDFLFFVRIIIWLIDKIAKAIELIVIFLKRKHLNPK